MALFRTGAAETGRVEAFSDGVLAIVITLLVLGITIPRGAADEAALWRDLLGLLPLIAGWVVSFAFVLIFWVAHHYLFAQLVRVDRGLLWLNGLFLLCICFTPFPAGLQAVYPGTRPASFLMCFAMLLTASSFTLLRCYASFTPGLMRPEVPLRVRHRAMRLSLIGPALYLLGTAAAFVHPRIAIAVQVIVPAIYILPIRHRET